MSEIPLQGGVANQGLVVRVGDTVRRPQRPWSRATHALLRHLQDSGFDGAPRYLGTDAQNREVLSYIGGDAVTHPYPSWALTDEALVSVARLLHQYHEAVATLDPSPFEWPASPPDHYVSGLVSHNDPNPHNVIFRNGRAVAFIDFDLASPGSALWDVAAAARLWVPLRSDTDISDSRRGQVLSRFRLFVDTYGLSHRDRSELVTAAKVNQEWLYSHVQKEGLAGNAGYLDYWRQAADRVNRTSTWLPLNQQELTRALLRQLGGGAATPTCRDAR